MGSTWSYCLLGVLCILTTICDKSFYVIYTYDVGTLGPYTNSSTTLNRYTPVLRHDIAEIFLTFMVQASNDAFISLAGAEDTNSRQNYYEINIGSSNGRHIDISRTSVKKNVHHSRTGKPVISREEARSFWISWDKGRIKVGSGLEVDKDMMLEWTDKHPFTVETIGLMTGWGSNGTWTILNDNVKGFHTEYIHTYDKGRVDSLRNLKDVLTYYTPLLIYGFDAGSNSALTFLVKTCSDAFVALVDARNMSSGENFYEIVIGAHRGRNFIFRRNGVGKTKIDSFNRQVLCNEYKPFWISWDQGNIQVGKGLDVDEEPIMEFSDPNPFAVEAIGIMTSHGSNGTWIFNIIDTTTVVMPDKETSTSTFITSEPVIDKSFTTLPEVSCARGCYIRNDCRGFYLNNETSECQLVENKDNSKSLQITEWEYYRIMHLHQT